MSQSPDTQDPFGPIDDRPVIDIITESAARFGAQTYDGADAARIVDPPNVAQVGLVLRALANYPLMRQAVLFAPDESRREESDRVAISVGRWMHQAANACEQEWQLAGPQPCATMGCLRPGTVSGLYDEDGSAYERVTYCQQCAADMVRIGEFTPDRLGARDGKPR